MTPEQLREIRHAKEAREKGAPLAELRERYAEGAIAEALRQIEAEREARDKMGKSG